MLKIKTKKTTEFYIVTIDTIYRKKLYFLIKSILKKYNIIV